MRAGCTGRLKQVRALAVARVSLCLRFSLSVHLPRAAAGPEVFVRDDTALGLDDLVAHPLPARDVLRDARSRVRQRPSRSAP
jgi:hypothetical protein